MISKNFYLLVVFIFLGLFIFYCGTTAVVDESLVDTQTQDVLINNDIGGDVLKDTFATDVENKDVDNNDIDLSDSISDVLYEDRETVDILEDVVEDVKADAGGDDGGGKDTSYADNELTDTSVETYSISGKVTVNGGKPEVGKNVYVMIFDKFPEQGVDPKANVIVDSNNEYFIDGLSPGKYYILAIYDINGDGNPNPDDNDPMGFYRGNPVEIKDSSITGIDIDIRTIHVSILSLFMQRQQSRNAYLIILAAWVVDPNNGNPLTDAIVNVTDPANPQHNFELNYNPDTQQYEKQFNPYGFNAVLAVEGDYNFTVQHPAYGPQPINLKIHHKPRKELITIIQPANNSDIQSGEDLTVEWKNPSEADVNMMILLLSRVGNQMIEKFRDDKQPIANPYVIKGSYLEDIGTYLVNVMSGRFSIYQNGMSIEATSGAVLVNINQ